MSQRVGGMVEEDVNLPGGTYFAQFIGFTRNKEGDIVLKEKTSTWTDKKTGQPVHRTVDKLYWQFVVVTGPEVGVEAVGSTAYKGVDIIPTEQGPIPRFKAPGAYAPNLIAWASACGLDFVADLSKPIFETPLTPQTILRGMEGILLDKASEGHVVAIKVEETPDSGSWVAWEGGVMAAPQETTEMLAPQLASLREERAAKPASAAPVQAEQQHLAEYVRYLMGMAGDAEAIDIGALEENIRTQVKGWGIKLRANVPILSLLTAEQLHQVIDEVLAVLLSEEIEFEPWTPDKTDELLKDIPF